MARVAFCGLGQMGERMAARLLEGEEELVVWNRSPERADALDDVVFSDEGLASGIEVGTTLVEMSTVGPDAVRRLAESPQAGPGGQGREAGDRGRQPSRSRPSARTAARAWFEAAEEADLGAMDYSAMIAHIRGVKASLT